MIGFLNFPSVFGHGQEPSTTPKTNKRKVTK